jgi:hypothetical protein
MYVATAWSIWLAAVASTCAVAEVDTAKRKSSDAQAEKTFPLLFLAPARCGKRATQKPLIDLENP